MRSKVYHCLLLVSLHYGIIIKDYYAYISSAIAYLHEHTDYLVQLSTLAPFLINFILRVFLTIFSFYFLLRFLTLEWLIAT